jgi:hypothetical protein
MCFSCMAHKWDLTWDSLPLETHPADTSSGGLEARMTMLVKSNKQHPTDHEVAAMHAWQSPQSSTARHNQPGSACKICGIVYIIIRCACHCPMLMQSRMLRCFRLHGAVLPWLALIRVSGRRTNRRLNSIYQCWTVLNSISYSTLNRIPVQVKGMAQGHIRPHEVLRPWLGY